MKKLFLIIGSLMLWSLLQSVNAQPMFEDHDSTAMTNVGSIALADAGNVKVDAPEQSGNPIVQRIPVKVGDLIRVSATVLDNQTAHENRFWKSVTKAVVPGFMLGNNKNYPATGAGEQPIGRSNQVSVGANLAIVPGALDLSSAEGRSKVFVGLAVYDTASQRIATVTDFLTNAAQKDWQKLQVEYRVEQNGFVEVIGSRGETGRYAVETFGKNNWLEVNKLTNAQKNTSDEVQSTSRGGGGSAPTGGATTSTASCIAWYWCTTEGCEYLFTECSCDDCIDSGSGPGGSGPPPPNDELGLCSENLNIALDRCFQNFALAMAAAAAMSEAPPAAAITILAAIIANDICKQNAFQDFNNCARNAGF